jgi:hypothetical protein
VVLAKVEALVRAKDVEGARRLLLEARRSFVRTVDYDRLTLRLARLELDVRRFAIAAAYAREAERSRDAGIRAEAARLRAAADQAQRP